MDQQHHAFATSAAARHDGWDPERKARFLAILAEHGNVRLAAARVGRSPQSVYVQRRRDALFGRAWQAALVHARDVSEQVFAERALEGVEEPVFYKGEQVGTRRRYDNRLLLAHMARLDRMAEDRKAMQDAARFDELLALVAGERFDGAEDGGDPLPPRARDMPTTAPRPPPARRLARCPPRTGAMAVIAGPGMSGPVISKATPKLPRTRSSAPSTRPPPTPGPKPRFAGTPGRRAPTRGPMR